MGRFLFAIAALLVVASPLPAQKPASVALEPGDAVSLHIDAGGGVTISPRGRADWTQFDIAAARHLSGLSVPDRPEPYGTPLPADGTMPDPPAIAPGMIRLKFLSVADRHSLLVIENGYDQAIAYRARLTREGRTAPTDVCVVMPRRHGFEHWPEVVDRLEIYDVRFVAWRDGDPLPCA